MKLDFRSSITSWRHFDDLKWTFDPLLHEVSIPAQFCAVKLGWNAEIWTIDHVKVSRSFERQTWRQRMTMSDTISFPTELKRSHATACNTFRHHYWRRYADNAKFACFNPSKISLSLLLSKAEMPSPCTKSSQMSVNYFLTPNGVSIKD